MPADPADRPVILGGKPARPAGPPAWPINDADVQESLNASFRDGSWGVYHGPNVERLEQELARYHGVDFALTCSSGTVAVELALRAIKVQPDDEVILAAYDFPGNFLTVLALGARPVLVDLDSDNWNLDAEQLEAAMNSRTRAIIVSHLHGGVVRMSRVMEVARRHGVPVVEDAAQMPGGQVEGRRAGTWGDVGTLSFGGSKLLSAGRGGAIITANREIHHRARLVCQRGSNPYALSELQAAVLLPQLAKLDARNAIRAGNVKRLRDSLAGVAGLQALQNSAVDSEPGYYKVGFKYEPGILGDLSRERFVEAVRAEGIAIDAGFRSLHVGRSTARFRAAGNLAQAEKAHHAMIVLHHPVLLDGPAQIDEVVKAVNKIVTFREAIQHEASPSPRDSA